MSKIIDSGSNRVTSYKHGLSPWLTENMTMDVSNATIDFLGRPYYRVDVTYTDFIRFKSKLAGVYNKAIKYYLANYNGNENLLWLQYDYDLSPSFHDWLQRNKFYHMSFSGFIMEGKTATVQSMMDTAVETNRQTLPFTEACADEVIVTIDETDELWRATNKYTGKQLLETPEDMQLIRILWTSAYMKQVFSKAYYYQSHCNGADIYLVSDRSCIDHDIFDYAFSPNDGQNHCAVEELLSDQYYKLTTALWTGLLMEATLSTTASFYIHRIVKPVPWPLDARKGREFEYNFYKNEETIRAAQAKFYFYLDLCLGHTPPYSSEIFPLVEVEKSIRKILFENSQFEDDNGAPLLGHVGYQYVHYNFYSGLKKIVLYALQAFDLQSATLGKYKIVVDGPFSCYLPERQYGEINIRALCGFWGSGKTQYIERYGNEKMVKIYEISEVWREDNNILEHPIIMFGSWLVSIYNNMRHSLLMAGDSNFLSVALDRSPVCFLVFFMMSHGFDKSCLLNSYLVMFDSLFKIFGQKLKVEIVWHDSTATLPWPIKAERELERRLYPTIEHLRNKKLLFCTYLDCLGIKFPQTYIFDEIDTDEFLNSTDAETSIDEDNDGTNYETAISNGSSNAKRRN